MHGLVNRAIQRFVTDSYGAAQWRAATDRAGLGFSEFEAMWSYDDAITPRVLEAVCDVLDRGYDELLEDIGTYLVSHPGVEALRRLLRFSGVSFIEFLHSLDDLPDRARLAVSDLELPDIALREHLSIAFEVSSVPLSETTRQGYSRNSAIRSSSRATRAPPMEVSTTAASVPDPAAFKSGRQFAAYAPEERGRLIEQATATHHTSRHT